jgi:undecaprenyl diphosphate synthase
MGQTSSLKRLVHLAFIMDGNGTWAEHRRKPRVFGHKAGAKNLRRIIEYVLSQGIPFLTLYAFSTENWKRSGYEVTALMRLFKHFTNREVDALVKLEVRVRFIGRRDRLDPVLVHAMERMEAATAGGAAMLLQVAIDYGGRDELRRAFEKIRQKHVPVVTEEDITEALDTAGVPDPDLIIRTGGHSRTSNFMLWQQAYAEWYFTETLWPDMAPPEIATIIDLYRGINRSFGGMPSAAE